MTLLSGKEKTVSASTKIYIRTLNRFFRIPIFQSSINGGKSDIAAFYIDPAEYSALNYLDRISKDEAMYLALTSGLTTEIGNNFKRALRFQMIFIQEAFAIIFSDGKVIIRT